MALISNNTDPTTWTPEEIMRDYHGEVKGDLFIRCAEWYTNEEVERKINLGRTNPIKNSNFYAGLKRSMTAVALQEGRLPTMHRLRFDQRRLANLKARFGDDHKSVKMLARSVAVRESVGRKYNLLERSNIGIR